ncbi:MAG: hypothetical protein KDK39_03920, partial [Leptospiraceae bacterium]|nr:hypothetical protein [Leptospiraceae bacterium]
EQPPGTFGPGLSKKHLFVRTGDGLLAVLELQPRGRKQLTAQDFLNGYRAGPFTSLTLPADLIKPPGKHDV